MKKLSKWKMEFLEEESKMSNATLLEETLNLAAGDDYDGCFTARGEWRYGALQTELKVRLIKCGFLEEEQK